MSIAGERWVDTHPCVEKITWGCVVACVLALSGCGDDCAPGALEAGQICNRPDSLTCSGDVVLKCAPPAKKKSCRVWAPTVDCATASPGPLTCGVKTGAASCQCPAAANGQMLVDPVEGGEAKSGSYATGVPAPASCRFRHLGEALVAARKPGTKVLVSTDAARLPITLTGETFPLAVQAGVAVSAADPAQYHIQFDGGSARAAVVLAEGASFEGFTIASTGGNPAAAAISCDAGSVTLRALRLDGRVGAPAGADPSLAMLGTGLAIRSTATSSCAATVDDVELTGFVTGVSVETTGAMPSVLDRVTVREAATAGFALSSGTVQATALTIEKSGGLGIAVNASSASTPAALEADTVAVSDTAQPALEIRATGGMPRVTIAGATIAKAGNATAPAIRQQAGTLALTDATIGDSPFNGFRMTSGSATLGNVTISGSGDDGLRMEGGTLNATGLFIRESTGDGVEISGGEAHLTQGSSSANRGRGMFFWGGVVAVKGPQTIADNGLGAERASGLRFERGNLTVTGDASAPIAISHSGLQGINIEGPGQGGSVAVSGVSVSGSAEYGMHIDLNAPGGRALVSDVDLHDNPYGGVVIRRAPSRAEDALVLEKLRVHGNGSASQPGVGIWVRGDQGSVFAVLRGNDVQGNSDCGVRVSQGAGLSTELALEDNVVAGNNTANVRAAGGLWFESSSTLTKFAGNRIFGNRGDQIFIAAPADGGGVWALGGSCASPNSVSCYGTSTGLRLGSGVQVDASGVSWQSATPIAGRDFIAPPDATLTATSPCAAAPVTCPE